MGAKSGLILTAALVLSVCVSLPSDAQPTPDFRFSDDQRSLSIPFELTTNKIYLHAWVNDIGPFWFVLDTGGATGSLLDVNLGESIGLRCFGFSERLMGVGEKPISSSYSDGVKLAMQGLALYDQKVTVMPLNTVLSPFEGRRFDGTFGYNLFRRVVVEIDYVDRLVNLYDPSTYRYTGRGTVIPLRIAGNHAHVRAVVAPPGRRPIGADLIVDTGARVAVLLHTPFVNKHRLLDPPQKTIFATVGAGLGGEAKWYIGRLTSLQIGTIVSKDVVTSFSEATRGLTASDRFDGLIGGEFLKRFKTIFDYPNQRLILEKTKLSGRKYEFDMSGAFLIAEPPELRSIKVLRVLPDSPAAEAGLQEGDALLAIDGRSVHHLTLEDIREMFRASKGKEHGLDIRRGQTNIGTRIRLKRLV